MQPFMRRFHENVSATTYFLNGKSYVRSFYYLEDPAIELLIFSASSLIRLGSAGVETFERSMADGDTIRLGHRMAKREQRLSTNVP